MELTADDESIEPNNIKPDYFSYGADLIRNPDATKAWREEYLKEIEMDKQSRREELTNLFTVSEHSVKVFTIKFP